MKVLLTGATGQLGQALIATKPPGVELIATSRSGGAGLLALDLATPEACRAAVHAHCPDWVLNAGAYTAVDRAESEPALAQAVNADAPAACAEALAATGGRLLQVSTDFVFNGAQGSPYRPEQDVDPLGAYGASKAAGEAAALQLPGARVLRTGWVHGPVGHNCCLTMLRLHRERQQLGVVADQVGCPTSTATLSAACWRAIGVGLEPAAEAALPRILHWSDAGVASWYDFAVAIGELGVVAGLLERAARVLPISTADYPTPARRPSYSLLDCTTSRAALGMEPLHWRAALAQVLSDASPTLSPSRQAA
ncbi:dTDP-4-dehydrorhamnose reductase [Cyanobium sp. Alchichica 3B3-8F6]|uniref:dTDP-4-dehydrorhamnose reductase n=1 Tax=Cyanobium sp. Alchichica 3B3-8F6 TaxID=2823696 RepID=UPI0020CD8713|nr:dTDP-4-dehydrorhamnose reductase [Cyanobium sp. Alchichica 3B3-8F6]MCP9881514.1 dTDP-4-dehydrorhamnose reductase [Cyanobium sp. Alchichica 3B3-8F6]